MKQQDGVYGVGNTRAVQLLTHVSGAVKAEHFTVVETPLQQLKPGLVLVRNRCFRVSISTRLMASEGAKGLAGIPFLPLNPGDTLMDAAIGDVVAVGEGVGFGVGAVVMHPLGWREHAVVAAAECRVLPPGRIEPAAWLGHGWTAYSALTRVAQIQTGDTVFVSSGAGAIGTMAGQMARLFGAKRVIGSTSNREKAHWMQQALGYDAVIVRDEGSMPTQLAYAAPKGIDVIVDMVGGAQLEAAIALANKGARCVLLGALAAELHPDGAHLNAPVTLDAFQLILNGITLSGFSACEEAPEAFDAWLKQLGTWQTDGVIELSHSTIKGIKKAPFALQEACAGRLTGLVLIDLEAE